MVFQLPELPFDKAVTIHLVDREVQQNVHLFLA